MPNFTECNLGCWVHGPIAGKCTGRGGFLKRGEEQRLWRREKGALRQVTHFLGGRKVPPQLGSISLPEFRLR